MCLMFLSDTETIFTQQQENISLHKKYFSLLWAAAEQGELSIKAGVIHFGNLELILGWSLFLHSGGKNIFAPHCLHL